MLGTSWFGSTADGGSGVVVLLDISRRESTTTAVETICSSSSSHHPHSFEAFASTHKSGKSYGHNRRLCNGCPDRIDSKSSSFYFIFFVLLLLRSTGLAADLRREGKKEG